MTEHIGGQAVIEGVMMKSENKLAVSVRLPDNKIKTKKEKLKKRSRIFKKPFFRGFFVLLDTLIIGIRTILWSADQQMEEHEKITKFDVFLTLAITIGSTILFFIVLPYFLTSLAVGDGWFFNLIDGLIRLAIFLIYFMTISFMKDIRVLFQYHGAEHKTINCHEAGKALTVKNAKKFSTLNPRCGTSFMLIVMIISIIIFSIIHSGQWYINIGARIVLIPVIASISYEILKISSRYKKNPVMAAITFPGMLLQRISTKEPTKKQLEVAIESLRSVL